MVKKIYAILFFVLIITAAVLNIAFLGSNDFSGRENRELAKLPSVSVKSIASGEYFKGLDAFFNDRFMQRDNLVELSSEIKSGISKFGVKSIISDDRIKNISVLKLEPGDNPVVRYKDNVYFVFDGNKAQINRYTKAVNFVSYGLDNIDVSVMLVPTALEFVENFSEIFGISSQRNMIDRASVTLNKNITFIDVYDTLKAYSDEYIYFRSDHHWTPLGAYYSYCQLSGVFGFEPVQYRPELAGRFCGSFADFTNSPEVLELSDIMSTQIIETQYWCHGGKAKASDAVQMRDMYPEEFEGYKRILGGDTGYIRIETMNKTDKRLLVIKDSYANALLPYLTEHYNRIITVDPRYFEGNLYETVRDEKITDVLFVNNTETISDDMYIEMLENLAGKTSYLERKE